VPGQNDDYTWVLQGCKPGPGKEISNLVISGCWRRSDVASATSNSGTVEKRNDGSIKITDISDSKLPLSVTVTFKAAFSSAQNAAVFTGKLGTQNSGLVLHVAGPTCSASSQSPTATPSPTPCLDFDRDTVCDANDNCPSWPNPGQKWPRWRVLSGDSDCDGFTDNLESYMATDPHRHCANDTEANNEPGEDGWPLDADDNGMANMLDIGNYVFVLNDRSTDPDFSPRFDTDQSGLISTVDIGLYVFQLNRGCSPHGE
jgi:hypothetical protein